MANKIQLNNVLFYIFANLNTFYLIFVISKLTKSDKENENGKTTVKYYT